MTGTVLLAAESGEDAPMLVAANAIVDAIASTLSWVEPGPHREGGAQ